MVAKDWCESPLATLRSGALVIVHDILMPLIASPAMVASYSVETKGRSYRVNGKPMRGWICCSLTCIYRR